ncbi:hypothetical protein Tco_0639412 [Tanacetum coccineum]
MLVRLWCPLEVTLLIYFFKVLKKGLDLFSSALSESIPHGCSIGVQLYIVALSSCPSDLVKDFVTILHSISETLLLCRDGDLTTMKFIQALVECCLSPNDTSSDICPSHEISLLNPKSGVNLFLFWFFIELVIGEGALNFTVSIAKISLGVFVRSVNLSCLLPDLCRALKSCFISKFD